MKRVYLCSPFRNKPENVEIARSFMAFALKSGVAPYASHLLYPQCLDDAKPEERELGGMAGLSFLLACDGVWWLTGSVTPGMKRELELAELHDKLIVPVARFSNGFDFIRRDEPWRHHLTAEIR